MIPQWILARLAQSGNRGAKSGTCVRCRQPTLTGLDADRCAMTVTVDASEVDAFGEALALARGVASFDLVLLGGQWELNYRNHSHIKRERKYPVLVSHECGRAYPRAENAHPLLLRQAARELPNEPPF